MTFRIRPQEELNGMHEHLITSGWKYISPNSVKMENCRFKPYMHTQIMQRYTLVAAHALQLKLDSGKFAIHKCGHCSRFFPGAVKSLACNYCGMYNNGPQARNKGQKITYVKIEVNLRESEAKDFEKFSAKHGKSAKKMLMDMIRQELRLDR